MRIKPSDWTGTLTIRTTNKKFAKTGQIEAVHTWKTGYQVLLFKTKESMSKWANEHNVQITNMEAA